MGAAPGIAPVSAVIPCYRCAGTIERAVRSVAEQTLRPAELILVDDASTDDTIAALERLRAAYGAGWIRILRQARNGGAAAARNAGWDAAREAYVAFLDADDSWLPHKIERQYAFFGAHPEFSLTGHRSDHFVPSAGRRGDATAPPAYTEITRARVLLGNPMTTHSLMMRREGTPRFDGTRRHMEDHRLLQDCVYAGVRVARIEENLALFHKAAYGAGGLSAELWAMERAELGNYAALRARGHIGAALQGMLCLYSLAKYARRCVRVALS